MKYMKKRAQPAPSSSTHTHAHALSHVVIAYPKSGNKKRSKEIEMRDARWQ